MTVNPKNHASNPPSTEAMAAASRARQAKNAALQADRDAKRNAAKAERKKKAKRQSAKATLASRPRTPDPKSNGSSNNAFYRSSEWKRARYEALLRSKGRCECCGARAGDGIVLNVDHIKPLRKYPHLALDPTNHQVLCASCNQGKGAWDKTDWRSARSEENTPLDIRFEQIMGDPRS